MLLRLPRGSLVVVDVEICLLAVVLCYPMRPLYK
jgi:hypothetical protein